MKTKQPILLVEDDSVDVMTLKRAFHEVGIPNPLHVVSNGEEALDFLRNGENKKPCLIFLDLNMPKMNGVEFLAVAKHDERLRIIPVVVLTTSKGDDDKRRCFELGVAGYMVKSVRFEEFTQLIRTIDTYWTASEFPF
jgi:CheY-like chemotaxis protein